MHRSRSNSKFSQDLNLRLGLSSPPNGEMFGYNCARGFPDLITIEDDDDVEIFSQRPFVEELRLFPCPSLSVPNLLEEDLELRLGPKVSSGFAGNQSNARNISDDGTEETSRTKKCFKLGDTRDILVAKWSSMNKKFEQASSSHCFLSEEVKLRCTICMDTMKEETSTLCGHLFCNPCIVSAIQVQRKCPTCRWKLTLSSIHRIYLPGATS